jgi:hypothetical protein
VILRPCWGWRPGLLTEGRQPQPLIPRAFSPLTSNLRYLTYWGGWIILTILPVTSHYSFLFRNRRCSFFKGLSRHFSKDMWMNGQQICKKKLDMTNHERAANQTTMSYQLHLLGPAS